MPRTSCYTGEVIEGTVVIETTREVSSRGLYVDFTGTEETVITRSAGKTTVTYRSKATVVQWRLPLRGEESVPPGTYRYPFQFQIPPHGLPSYAGRHASVKYILSARLDVPLWLDTVWTTEIYVFYDRPSVRTFAQPVRFRSAGQGPEVYVELDGDRFFARELIGCRITLSRTENARIRRVYTDSSAANGRRRTASRRRRRHTGRRCPCRWSRSASVCRSRSRFRFSRMSHRATAGHTPITAISSKWASTSPGDSTSSRRHRS